jgi:hypothetical protein
MARDNFGFDFTTDIPCLDWMESSASTHRRTARAAPAGEFSGSTYAWWLGEAATLVAARYNRTMYFL